jgi:ProQ/FINO family
MQMINGGEMTMLADRDDLDRGIETLCEEYPKAFFAVGKSRKPLKIDIEDDIKSDICKRESELRCYNIDDTLKWYRTHVGYQLACSTAGANRLDLNGKPVSKITEAEAREYEQDARESFNKINAYKRASAATPAAPSPPPPRPTALMVNSALGTPEMLALIEKQVASLRAILGDAIDESLRATLARPVLQLIRDELQTIDARLE